jgi:hypothetical protein
LWEIREPEVPVPREGTTVAGLQGQVRVTKGRAAVELTFAHHLLLKIE